MANQKAFSLLEILMVLVVISCLVSFSGPALSSLTGSRSLGKSCNDFASFLEYARVEAVTRQTYVWVGVQTQQISDRYDVVAGAVYSQDGTGNTAATNLVPLGKTVRIPFMRLVSRSELGSDTQSLLLQDSTGVLDNQNGISFSVGANHFAGQTLTFTPGGEVLLKGSAGPNDGYDAYIDFGLRQSKSVAIAGNGQEAALLVDGSNGAVKILRIQ